MPIRALRPYETVQAGRATIRFFHGDCTDLLARLPPRTLNVVITSPPYNLGVRYRTYDDGQPRQAYLEWTGRWAAGVARALAPSGSLFLNVGGKPTDPWTALDVAQAVRPHLHLQNLIHWVKSIAIEREAAGGRAGLADDLAVGHYKPINSARFLNDCHEFVFHFTPDGTTRLDRLAIGVKYQDPSNVSRWRGASGGLRCRGNTWFVPYETIQNRSEDRPHPATFPSRLPEYCIRLHGLRQAGVVADPFLGLGATTVACARLGVDAVGIEIDEHYLKEAIARTRAAAARGEPRTRRRSAV
ncbi:MAG: site-specific DNA-methyltransferase [Vicinamibacterales bacterium]